MKFIKIVVVLAGISAALSTSAAHAAEAKPVASELVQKAETLLWGKTLLGDFEMTVTTPAWERSLTLRAWMDRPRLSFIRILDPAKERGIASLRIGKEMWNYIPKIERSVKVPPSMMLQPWFSSDFTNDDMTKEGSFVTDYTHRLIEEREVSGSAAYVVELLPKPDSTVVWGKVIYSLRKADFVPLRIEYFDERGKLVRFLEYHNIQQLGGRLIPTVWEMRPADKPGKKTTITVKQVEYDKPMDGNIFTMRNLTRRNAGDQ